MSVNRLAVFVSGSGTNLQALIDAEKSDRLSGEIAIVISDKPAAYALTRAERAGISTRVFPMDTKKEREESYEHMGRLLTELKIDVIILAGFMRILPGDTVDRFAGRIINLHPALLPKYGGVGMYGDHVHNAVLAAGESISGATVHLVDAGCDTGPILGQAMVNVYHSDDADTLRNRIGSVERPLLVKIVERYLRRRSEV